MVSKIKTLINSLNKTLVLTVVLSIFAIFYAYFLLYLERRILNIPNSYHPDSVYYFDRYSIDYFLSINYSLLENLRNFYNNIFHNLFYLSIINIISEITIIINDSNFEFLKDTFYRNVVKFNIIFYFI